MKFFGDKLNENSMPANIALLFWLKHRKHKRYHHIKEDIIIQTTMK